ncbi:hypothetical protein ACFFVB_18535 [Formosa undariae]|uniref:DUF4468 domain-containing protein n=1 Tax=Formosa undariae TaxID=1325436 RepID=A0ABV5F6P9_9FLAO
MKIKLLILFVSISYLSLNASAQEVTFNESLNLYEFTKVQEYEGDIQTRLKIFENNLKELNYDDTEISEDRVKGESFFTKMIYGSAMEMHYNALIIFKEGRYKLTINNFKINDVRYGTVALETLKKGSQKRWVSFINENLPQVISNLEKQDTW